ncbi:MAG: DCC1-like thiol-disulfide oxidoreductase family protein [Myxococcota bacterium]
MSRRERNGGGFATSGLDRALLLIVACDPAWWRGRRLAPGRAPEGGPGRETASAAARASAGPSPARLFYDGDCGFCHRSVRFILAEELATPTDLRLRFAPLGSEPFRACLARHPELDAGSLPDSIVLELEDGVVLTRSAAALEIASRLGGFWRGLALAGRLVPTVLLDAGYDGIARIRKRLFAQPKDACPILPPDLRARFDA